jgi:hypothetical protein
LVNPDLVEGQVGQSIAESLGVSRRLQPVSWSDVANKVYAPKFVEDARRFANKVAQVYGTESGAPGAALRALLARLADKSGLQPIALFLEPELSQLSDAEQIALAPQIVKHALVTLLVGTLIDQGGTLQSELAEAHRVLVGTEVIEPFLLAEKAVSENEARLTIQRLLKR